MKKIATVMMATIIITAINSFLTCSLVGQVIFKNSDLTPLKYCGKGSLDAIPISGPSSSESHLDRLDFKLGFSSVILVIFTLSEKNPPSFKGCLSIITVFSFVNMNFLFTDPAIRSFNKIDGAP